MLYTTDFVIWDKEQGVPVKFANGDIIVYGNRDEAEDDCYDGQVVIPCTELPSEWKNILSNQLK